MSLPIPGLDSSSVMNLSLDKELTTDCLVGTQLQMYKEEHKP